MRRDEYDDDEDGLGAVRGIMSGLGLALILAIAVAMAIALAGWV